MQESDQYLHDMKQQREQQQRLAEHAKEADMQRLRRQLIADAEKRRDRALIESYAQHDRFSHSPPRGRRASVKPNQFGLPTATRIDQNNERANPPVRCKFALFSSLLLSSFSLSFFYFIFFIIRQLFQT